MGRIPYFVFLGAMAMKKARPQVVSISHSSLEKLFAGLSVRPPEGKDGMVLFALRGCLPMNAPDGWRASIKARIVSIDHVHMRCTLGIWDRRNRRVFAAPGSTVPHKDNVLKAAARKGKVRGRGANQLEPGFYTDLTKGEHLQGKRNGHQALRQTAYRFYRRSATGVPYPASSRLFYGNPYDNLHCGWNPDGKAPGFSSAGCLVVAGLPYCHRHETPQANQGPWKTFHGLLYGSEQETFPLLLVGAREAADVLEGDASGKTLLFGSEGEVVAALQKRLAARGAYKGAITGRLDSRTYRAWKA
jgi:hypothetical protein